VTGSVALGRYSGRGKKFFSKSIQIYKTNTNEKEYQHVFQIQGAPQRIIKVEKVLRLSDNAPSETGQITGLFRLFDCAAAS